MPNHHPLPETLISYASGTLPNAISCVVACHLTLCEECARNVRRLEILGGLLMSKLEVGPASDASVEGSVERWSTQAPPGEPESENMQEPEHPVLPLPLARYLDVDGEEIPWRTIVEGVQQYWISLPKGSGQIRLLRLAPGQQLPRPRQTANIGLALVLRGACGDQTGEYVRGDVIEWAQDDDNQPRVIGEEECICLIAGDAKPADFRLTDQAPRQLSRKTLFPELRLRDSWVPALAASVALIAGIGLGWVLRGGTTGHTIVLSDLVEIKSNRLIARGPLQAVLETLPSGGEKTAVSSQDGEIRLSIKMTFRNQEGDYCREYRIALKSPERYAGIACYTDGEWATKIQALLPPSPSASEQTVPAGGEPTMDAVVGALIGGDPLVGEDEARLLNNGWKK